jgi:fatty acid amide hydrolase 2
MGSSDLASSDALPLTQRSAVALAQAIRMREVTAREVVEAHIELLERAQPQLNPIAVERFAAARARAQEVDARVATAGANEELPPLLGVPCTVKEVFAVAGLPHTAGLVARRDVRASATAPAAQRLLDAGAILLGLSNTAELAAFFETDNRVYGRTSNPYDPRRTAGGSSGGCGAAVGSGGSPIGLGTDGGGSIRVPAFCCGVFGHKPSLGLVPHTGLFPVLQGETKRMVGFGPLARRAEDLMAVLRVIAGPDGADPLVERVELGDPASVELTGLRVLVSEHAFVGRISRELLEARERAAQALERAGAQIERVAMPQMRRMLMPTLATFSDAGKITVSSTLESAGAPSLGLRGAVRPRGPHTAPVKLLAGGELAFRRIPQRRLRRAIERGREFAAELAATIGDGVLLHPPLPTVAPRHGRTYGRVLFFQTVGVFSLAAVPVTQVPLGLNRKGLPLGVQVAAAPGRDHVAIAVAIALEQACGGWIPPPGSGRSRNAPLRLR